MHLLFTPKLKTDKTKLYHAVGFDSFDAKFFLNLNRTNCLHPNGVKSCYGIIAPRSLQGSPMSILTTHGLASSIKKNSQQSIGYAATPGNGHLKLHTTQASNNKIKHI